MSTKSLYTEHITESTFDDNAYKMQKPIGENAPPLISHISATLSTKFSNKQTLIQSLFQCPTNVYGIINVNKTYDPGSYYGWYYHSSYKMLYPFTDIHAAVGDSIYYLDHNVWLVSEDVYYVNKECQSVNQAVWEKQLAISNEIRSDQPLLQNWHGLHIDDVAGYGSISNVEIKSSGSNTYSTTCDKSQ
eukprot:60896_1